MQSMDLTFALFFFSYRAILAMNRVGRAPHMGKGMEVTKEAMDKPKQVCPGSYFFFLGTRMLFTGNHL